MYLVSTVKVNIHSMSSLTTYRFDICTEILPIACQLIFHQPNSFLRGAAINNRCSRTHLSRTSIQRSCKDTWRTEDIFGLKTINKEGLATRDYNSKLG